VEGLTQRHRLVEDLAGDDRAAPGVEGAEAEAGGGGAMGGGFL